jgi:hypothetical protein
MESWLVALIAAAGAVAGAAVSAVAVYRMARLDRDARDKDELRAALAGYGAAVDRLNLRIEQLPQAHGIEENRTTRMVARWRALDWLMGRLSVATIGRGAIIALDEMTVATNRLLLIAPGPVLDDMERLSDLIGRLDPSAASWRDEWKEARSSFAGTARAVVIGKWAAASEGALPRELKAAEARRRPLGRESLTRGPNPPESAGNGG